MTPFFLANFVNASDPAVYKRKIYIDLGIKDFYSSLCWIMQNYPVKFDAIHGFECASDLSNVAALSSQIDACVRGTAADLKQGYTPEGVKEILHIYYNYIGTDENPATQPPTRGLSQVMKDLNIEKDDYVVVKMDVEEMEYALLDKIIADGTYKLIDEVRKICGQCEDATGCTDLSHGFSFHPISCRCLSKSITTIQRCTSLVGKCFINHETTRKHSSRKQGT